MEDFSESITDGLNDEFSRVDGIFKDLDATIIKQKSDADKKFSDINYNIKIN
jgi:hypothetical protein